MDTNGRAITKQLRWWLILTGVVSCLLTGHAFAKDDVNQQVAEFLKWRAAYQQEFTDYVAKEQAEYAAFKKEVEKKWDTFAGSTKKDWVEYSPDKEARSIVDFEAGEVTLETVIVVDDKGQPAAAIEKRTALRHLLQKKLAIRLKKILASQAGAKKTSPVQGQIKTRTGALLTEKNLDNFAAKELVREIKVAPKPFIAKDGKKRIKARVTIKMIPEHVKVRAEKFRTSVERYAKQYDVPTALVFAIIHTESSFNPKARSHIPAYGLMQLVPRSGGRDAYKYVKKKDQPPTPDFLYKPDNNILLGTAYLDLLSKREFKRVKDRTAREYLVIASYNTGAGNVSRAFTGNKSAKKAVKVVNKMTAADVYTRLVNHLPYDETKRYIQKVVKRQASYQDF